MYMYHIWWNKLCTYLSYLIFLSYTLDISYSVLLTICYSLSFCFPLSLFTKSPLSLSPTESVSTSLHLPPSASHPLQLHWPTSPFPECNQSLADYGFYEHQGCFYCKSDYQRLFGRTCSVCQQAAQGSGVLLALDRTFHTECFRCHDCGAFLQVGQQVSSRGC